ncbi:MAG: hypothetical protein H6709_00490 [Kofleriaceae bacterium]|nr:hypothetical protein [Kofleriaceae bacterium]
MTRVRLMGRKADLARTLAALQDLGTVHLEPPPDDALPRRQASPAERRRHRDVDRVLTRVEVALTALAELGVPWQRGDDGGAAPTAARAARLAARTARDAGRLHRRARALTDERDALRAWAPLVADLEALLGGDRVDRRFAAHLLRLQRGGAGTLARLREALERTLDGACELRSHAPAQRRAGAAAAGPGGPRRRRRPAARRRPRRARARCRSGSPARR